MKGKWQKEVPDFMKSNDARGWAYCPTSYNGAEENLVKIWEFGGNDSPFFGPSPFSCCCSPDVTLWWSEPIEFPPMPEEPNDAE